MTGSIESRRPDYHRIRIYLGRDEFGKKRYMSEFVKGTKAEAERRKRELLSKLDRGEPVAPAKELLRDYLARWLRDYKEPKLSPLTIRGYRHAIERHIAPTIGHLRLDRIQPKDLQAYYSRKLTEGLSKTTVAYHARLLHSAFQTAFRTEQILGRNPVDFTDPPVPDRYEARVWTREQVLAFLEAAQEDRYYALWHLAVTAGLRLGELLGLDWPNVSLDTEPPYITVRQAVYTVKGHRGKKAPKSQKSVRTIVLDPKTADVLRVHRELMENERRITGRQDSGCFVTTRGRWPGESGLRKDHFLPIIRRAGLPVIRIHDLRHTHLTLLRDAGVDAKAAQARAGHSTITLTLERYTHGIPGEEVKTARQFADYLYGPSDD